MEKDFMTDLLETLKARIDGTDLEFYLDKDSKLTYALEYARAAVNNRRGFTPTDKQPYPLKYKMNILDGAVWYLGKIGAEGYSSTSENGTSISWKESPEWLSTIPGYIRIF